MSDYRCDILLILFIAIATLTGCEESTDPPAGPDVEIVFAPSQHDLVASRHETVSLRVVAGDGGTYPTVFTRGEETLASGSALDYVPVALGADSVLATVTVGDEEVRHLWRLTVVPAVPLRFRVGLGNRVYARWAADPDVAASVSPARYELRVRPGGTLDDTHWDEAYPLADVAYEPDRAEYVVVLDVGGPAIPPATTVGFGLRLVDESGGISPMARYDLTVPEGRVAEGTVTDPSGRPLAGVTVTWTLDNGTTRTDVDGRYRMHFLPDGTPLTVRYVRNAAGEPDTASWYDIEARLRDGSDFQPTVVMLPQMTIDAACASPQYADDFLNFLRDMTFTDRAVYVRPRYTAEHWAALPISCHVAEGWSDDGTIALHVLADSALVIWNERLGRPIFEPAATPESAQLRIFFANANLGTNIGVVRILDPLYEAINTVVPRLMTVQVRTDIVGTTYALEVLLHELGHALCVGGHSRCGPGCHLMQPNPRGIIAARWPESPISDDEVRLVNTIYAFPADYPLDVYRVPRSPIR